MRILVSGFEPAFGIKRTPSGELASMLKNGDMSVPGLSISGIVLPQIFRESTKHLLSAAASFKPDAIVMLGATPKSDPFRLERFAINIENTQMGDNSQIPVHNRQIVFNGPAAYEASWDCQKLSDFMKENHTSSSISYHAGTHTCNSIFYEVMHYLTLRGMVGQIKAGFVHMPFPNEFGISEHKGSTSSMSDLVSGLLVLLQGLGETYG